MKRLLLTVAILCCGAMLANAKSAPGFDKSLDLAMKNFIAAIGRKNPAAFLSYISKTKGLTIMNTIDQGEAGNADKPMFDETLSYATLAADFKKKNDRYRDFFFISRDSPNFYESFAGLRTKWKNFGGNVYMPDENGIAVKQKYVKWEKENGRWVVVEVGRMIS